MHVYQLRKELLNLRCIDSMFDIYTFEGFNKYKRIKTKKSNENHQNFYGIFSLGRCFRQL